MEKTIRQIAREKAVIAVYQWLTVDASKEELKEYKTSYTDEIKNAKNLSPKNIRHLLNLIACVEKLLKILNSQYKVYS